MILSKSKFIQKFTPIKQLVLIGTLMLIAITIEYALSDPNKITYNPNASWEMMGTFVLFFILANAVLSLSIDRLKNYWKHSILAFALLFGIGYLVCYLMTGNHIHEAGSMIYILGLFCFVFLLILSIVRTMRTIFEYVEKQDKEMRDKQSK